MGFLDRLFKKEYNPNDRLSDRCEAVKKLKDQDKLIEILKTDNGVSAKAETPLFVSFCKADQTAVKIAVQQLQNQRNQLRLRRMGKVLRHCAL